MENKIYMWLYTFNFTLMAMAYKKQGRTKGKIACAKSAEPPSTATTTTAMV
jgi:hypothetical protein